MAQIPVGSGSLQTVDFDLDAFQAAFHLPGRPLVGALKRLEEAGFISRTDSYRSPAKLQLLWPFDKLYEHQMRNPRDEPLLKTLLRVYGGLLFSEEVAISEALIGAQLGQDGPSVGRHLQALARQGLLDYVPASEKPQLTFLTERYAPENLPLRAERLEQRKQDELARAKMVISLATDTQACRMVRLVGYFGQTMPQVCGQCDVCLKNKKK
jgi:ATP-dependent DNA helicase RecQ